jgi:hypothetical protein
MASPTRAAGDDGARIIRKGDRGEPQPDTDPLEELIRIVGESPADNRRPQSSARRPRLQRRG